jgi:hypothetical protein
MVVGDCGLQNNIVAACCANYIIYAGLVIKSISSLFVIGQKLGESKVGLDFL